MGNDSADRRRNHKSHFHSSTESLEDMDTSDSTASPHWRPHTYKAGCPCCSGLCSFRSPAGHSSGDSGTHLSVDRPPNAYAGTTKDYRADHGLVSTPGGSLSHQFTSRDDHFASSYDGASSTTYNHRSDSPRLGNAGGYGLGGASGTTYNHRSDSPRLDNAGSYGLGGASSTTYNNSSDALSLGNARSYGLSGAGRPSMNSMVSYGIGTAEPFKSPYEAGYDAGLKDGYQLALMDLAYQRVNAANGNGSEERDLLALDNGRTSVRDDCIIGAAGRSNQHHNPSNSNYNSSAREIVLLTNDTGQAGYGQSSVESSAANWVGTRADKDTKPHNDERAEELSASSSPSLTHRYEETGRNVFGMTEADNAAILVNAAKVGKSSDEASHTHSDRNDTKWFKSVRPMFRSMSNGPETRKEKSPRPLFSNLVGKGSTRTINENANGWDAAGKSKINLLGAASSQRQLKFRKKPVSRQEKLLADYTTEVFHQPRSSEVPSTKGVFASTSSGNNTAVTPPDCSICITSLAEDSPYSKPQDKSRDLVGCAALKLCGHHFHISCLMQMASHDASWLTCPNCQTIHGVRIGTQPKGGTLNFRRYGGNLPGFPRSSGTIEITYSFRNGKQGPEHPNPGRPYHLVGFPRVAYLPDTAQGNKVLNLLRVAFERRLTFTVGTSATSGSENCVVWNGIHHKTETRDSSGHGYPDPKYLDNVTMELASFGVA